MATSTTTRIVTASDPSAEEPEEQAVEEVHCAECNAPMTMLPSWYANVRVNFTCDACRSRSAKVVASPTIDGAAAAAASASANAESKKASAVDEDAEVSVEDEESDTDELEVDDAEISEEDE